MENRDIMTVLDEDGTTVLYRMKNDIFDTVALVYHDGEPNEEGYVLTDMQGPFPTTLSDVSDYDWVPADQVDW